MSSGLFNYTQDSAFAISNMENPLKSYTHMELIEISQKHAPDFAPGTSIHYSNPNYLLLGMIIEKITGNTLLDEVQKRILDRLAMTNTSFAVNADFPNPHAHGYEYTDASKTEPADVTEINPSWARGAGSMISTLGDLGNT